MRKCLLILLSALLMCSCSAYRARSMVNKTGLSTATIEATYKPRGTVEEFYHGCSVPGPTRRRMIVYLPEGYCKSTDRYPVFYLIHGARGNETSWIVQGNILHIADSLFATGKAKPCIIVLPNLNYYTDDKDYGHSRMKNPVEALFETDGRAESAFVHDVVSVVDSLYRTIPDKNHRAIGGMSLGALQSIYISAWHPELFDYIGMFSPMYKAPPRHGKYAWFYGHLKHNQVAQFANPPKIYDIEIGRADFFYPHIANYRRYLARKGYCFQYFEYDGGHEWYNWKKSYCNFLQMIF